MSGRPSSASSPLTKTKHPEMTFVNVERSSLPEERLVSPSQPWEANRRPRAMHADGTHREPPNAILDELTHLAPVGRDGSTLRPPTGGAIPNAFLGLARPVSWDARQSASSLGNPRRSAAGRAGMRRGEHRLRRQAPATIPAMSRTLFVTSRATSVTSHLPLVPSANALPVGRATPGDERHFAGVVAPSP